MKLIERYIYAIKRRLPGTVKEDLAQEIESLIYDELEEKFGEKAEYSQEQVEEVIDEMGHPSKVAERYRGDKQYLVGPTLFPVFKMVASIVLGATTFGLVVAFIVERFAMIDSGLWENTMDFFMLIPSLFSALIGAFGGVALTFSIIERVGNFDGKEVNLYEDWKVKDLPELPEENEIVRLWEPIVAITFGTLGILFFNAYVYNGGLLFIDSFPQSLHVYHIFDFDALRYFLPLWNISFIFSMVPHFIHIRTGRYTLLTRIWEIASGLFGLTILAIMRKGPIIVSQSVLNEITNFMSIENVDAATNNARAITILMVLITIGIVVNVIKLIVNQARKANV